MLSAVFLFANENTQKPDSLSTIEFSFVGDIMCHSTQFNFVKVGADSFDFKPVYREIKPYLENSDVVVGNLETVIEVEGVKFSGYPVFNTPKEFLEGLRFAGFDILSTANNHAFDIRERGVKSTIEYIKKYNMQGIGTYDTQSKRDSVIINEKNEIKFSILSYTYGVNLYSIPSETSYLVNRIDSDIIKSDIRNHRLGGADIVIVFFHFGLEYSKLPNEFQRQVVAKTIESGADIIIGAHPHTLQPIEYFSSSSNKIDSGFVAYSLGNFVSNQRWRYSDGGAILNFSVQKNHNSGKVTLAGVRYLPIWVFKGSTANGSEYIVLPAEVASSKEYLSEKDIAMAQECSNDTETILTTYTKNIEIDTINKSRVRNRIREFQKSKKWLSRIQMFGFETESIKLRKGKLQMIEIDSTLSSRILNEIQ